MAAPYKDLLTGTVVQLEPKDVVGKEGRYFQLHQSRPDQDAIQKNVLAAQKGQTPYQAQVLADGAIGYWPLDDAAGATTVRGLIGGHGHVVGAPTFGVPGIGGSTALQCGTDPVYEPGPPDYDYDRWAIEAGWVIVPPPPALPQFSLEVWGYLLPYADTMGLSPVLVAMRTEAENGADNDSCAFIRFETRTAQRIEIGAVGAYAYVEGADVPPRAWQHWVLTWDHGTGDGVPTLYRNGVARSSYESVSDLGDVQGGTIYTASIGNDPGEGDGESYMWRGRIQDVAFYDRVLTLAEVQAHCTARRALDPQTLLARTTGGPRPSREERTAARAQARSTRPTKGRA